nr:immunoglobulin heavy chain junction region [Mus musculus]
CARRAVVADWYFDVW